jgi:capsid protein
MPQAWPYIHPVQDVEAAQLEVRNGLASRSGKVSERGDDVEVIDAEQAADNTRADELGLKYDSDGRQPKNGGQQKNASSGTRAAA